tara:strand:+ start:244 stop:516 length:273 start_codon:yes stop_codon:yes gene_type:complete
MNKKIISILFLSIHLILLFIVINYYSSEENKLLVNKSRSSYSFKLNQNLENLFTLENDTSNIIIYLDDLQNFKSQRKKHFWEKLISNSDE